MFLRKIIERSNIKLLFSFHNIFLGAVAENHTVISLYLHTEIRS